MIVSFERSLSEKIVGAALLSIAVSSCTEKSPERQIIGAWSVDSVAGSCYQMSWENGDRLDLCYEYPRFSFTVSEEGDGNFVLSDIDGEINFVVVATYAGEEPIVETDILDIVGLRLFEQGENQYEIKADVVEDGVETTDYFGLRCTLTDSSMLNCDLDEEVERGEEEIFPDFTLIFRKD